MILDHKTIIVGFLVSSGPEGPQKVVFSFFRKVRRRSLEKVHENL